MTYVSNTPADRAAMLEAIGCDSLEELLVPIPAAIRLQGLLNLPAPMREATVLRHLQEFAAKNLDFERAISFLGAGIYDHFRPAVVGAMTARGEFATSYTPYQPELSQGMLQAIYEYQSMVCALTAMDLANASMYDAATAAAEAALMAIGTTGRTEVLVSQSVHPHYRAVLAAYLGASGFRLREIPALGLGTDIEQAESVITEETACLLLQYPNFFGSIEPVDRLFAGARDRGAVSVVIVDPVSLGLLRPPGELGADVAVGEGQGLGCPAGFGGPLLGFFACSSRFVRAFPGRIVGATVDRDGTRGYTMTLRTREQDIRRERATSNICTNEALLALAATVHLAALGADGLRDAAALCTQKAHYAADCLEKIPGVRIERGAPFLKEFVARLPVPPDALNEHLAADEIIGGLPLGGWYPGLHDSMLFCVTENRTKDDIDRLAASVRRACERAQ